MTTDSNTTPPGAAETVATLHARWASRLDKLNTLPGLPNAKREKRLDDLQALEDQIARTAAATFGEVILKLRMIQSGKVTGMGEGRILASAIRDIGTLHQLKT